MLHEYDAADAVEAYHGMVRGIALPRERTPQERGAIELPKDTIIVSADSHWSLVDDIFYERFPPHLKDRAPRLETAPDGRHHWYMNGENMLPPSIQNVFANFESIPGATSIEPRLRDLDIEGVQKEIVFGNAIATFYGFPDLEVREWVFRIYNQHLAKIAQKAPGRFYGVGLINYWDMSKVRESLAELKAQGFKTFILPQYPKGADGIPLNYCLPEMEPLWEAIEEAGLPVCFHIGEFYQAGPGSLGTGGMVNFGPFRKTLGELIFGGILDRHPTIQVTFAEAEVNWVPGALQTATMMYECFGPHLEPKIKHHPRHYWHNNCYAIFMHDPVGMRMLDIVGTDRVMWSADYPHQESTLGFGWSAIKTVLDAVSPNEARMILGGTAMKVFNL